MDDKMEDSMEKGISGLTVRVVEVEVEEEPMPKPPAWKRRSRNCVSVIRRSLNRRDTSGSPWPILVRRTLYLLSVITGLLTIAFVISHSLLFSLVHRLSPPRTPSNGLTQIVESWVEPGSATSSPAWLPNFSRDVSPKPIHSHNDYWRRVPLFEALSLGISSVEADCHLINGSVYVGHTSWSLRSNRTLKSLYLDPLWTILENQNAENGVAGSSTINGVWDVNSTAGIVLLTDLKTAGAPTLAAVQQQLEPFRQKGWLTYWNGTNVVPGPITHVATGNTPFSAVLNSTISNSAYRSVFFDAPLERLSNIYNVSNSYYASTSLKGLFRDDKIPSKGLNKHQVILVKSQLDYAASLGLVSRYWDTPSWPVMKRTNVWRQLQELGVGILNVDAIEEAARWNWRWCNILGLELC